MKPLPDSAGNSRRDWLRQMQEESEPLQSDFENSLAFRSTLIAAVIVIGINIFAPPSVPLPAPSGHVHAIT